MADRRVALPRSNPRQVARTHTHSYLWGWWSSHNSAVYRLFTLQYGYIAQLSLLSRRVAKEVTVKAKTDRVLSVYRQLHWVIQNELSSIMERWCNVYTFKFAFTDVIRFSDSTVPLVCWQTTIDDMARSLARRSSVELKWKCTAVSSRLMLSDCQFTHSLIHREVVSMNEQTIYGRWLDRAITRTRSSVQIWSLLHSQLTCLLTCFAVQHIIASRCRPGELPKCHKMALYYIMPFRGILAITVFT